MLAATPVAAESVDKVVVDVAQPIAVVAESAAELAAIVRIASSEAAAVV